MEENIQPQQEFDGGSTPPPPQSPTQQGLNENRNPNQQESGYGRVHNPQQSQPGYGGAQNQYQQQPGYNNGAQNQYQQQPGYNGAQNSYQQQPGFGGAQNQYQQQPGFGGAQNQQPGYNGTQSSYQQPQQNVYVNNVEKKTNSMGTAGMVLAIVALFTSWVPILGWIVWLLGLIFSIVGVFREPRGMAIAGLVISFIDFIIMLALIGFMAAGLSSMNL